MYFRKINSNFIYLMKKYYNSNNQDEEYDKRINGNKIMKKKIDKK